MAASISDLAALPALRDRTWLPRFSTSDCLSARALRSESSGAAIVGVKWRLKQGARGDVRVLCEWRRVSRWKKQWPKEVDEEMKADSVRMRICPLLVVGN